MVPAVLVSSIGRRAAGGGAQVDQRLGGAEFPSSRDRQASDRLAARRTASDLQDRIHGQANIPSFSRLRSALDRIADRNMSEDTVIVTTHGLAARIGICLLLGIPQAHWPVFGALSN